MRIRIDELLDLLINGGGNRSDQKRVRFLVEGFSIFLQNFFIGDGTAASYNYFDTYSHSNILEILLNNGILGFLVFYFAYPIVIFQCIKKRQLQTSEVNMSNLCLFLFLSILVLSIALVYYTFIYYEVLLAVAAAYVLNDNMMKERKDDIV